jgi:hypothetical protein
MSNEETLKDYYEPPSAVKVKRDGNRATQQYFKEKQDLYLKGEITFEECRKEIYNSRVSSVNSITKMKRVAFYKKNGEQKIPGTYGLAELETLLEVCFQQIGNLQDEKNTQHKITSAKNTIKSHWDKVSSLYFPFMIQKGEQSANIRIFPIYYRLNDFYVCLSLFVSDHNWFTQGLPIPDNLYLDNPPGLRIPEHVFGNTDEDAEEGTVNHAHHGGAHTPDAALWERGGGVETRSQKADVLTLLRQMKEMCGKESAP